MQLEPLKIQSEKAMKYLEYKEELQGVEVALWLDALDRLSAAAKKAEEDYTSASFVLQQAHEELERLYASAEALGQQLRDKDGDLETARLKVNMLEATHQQLDGQMAVLRSNVSNNDANIARIREEMQGAADRSGGVVTQIDQTRHRIGQIEQLLAEKNQQLQSLQQELTALAASAQGITRQFLELRGQETSLSAEIAGREADLRALEESMEQTRQRMDLLREDLSSGESREEAARQQLLACSKELRKAQEDVTAANNTISGYTLRQTTRGKRRDELALSVRELTAKLDAVSAKVKVFRAMERDFESYNKSVRMVMQEAQRGSLRGIHGPVSRLIRTDDDYTVAIEIALGAAMQNIVVGAEADAKAAMSYLKRTGGGRATFLPMTTVKGRSLNEPGVEKCRGFVSIASGLVSCDEQYRPVVEDLLGRTVIAQDIDAAIAMANKFHHRFRIVTLDGQVMNAGGSMTGGSVNKEAGILSRANELEKLTQQEQQLQKKLNEQDEQLREAQRLVDQVEFQMAAARDQLREAEDQVLRLQGQEKQYEIILQTIVDAVAAANRELEALQKRDSSDRERYAASQAKLQVYTAQLEQTRAGLQKLEGTQTEADESTARITSVMTSTRAETAALEAEKTTALAHIEDLQSLRAAMEGDREKKQVLIDAIQAESQRLLQEIAQLQIRQEETDRQTDTQRAVLKQVMTDRAEAEATKTRTERESQEKSKDILNMERACALLEQKKATSALEEKQIIDRLWDSYGLTPGTAVEHRGQIESVAAGQRRVSEL